MRGKKYLPCIMDTPIYPFAVFSVVVPSYLKRHISTEYQDIKFTEKHVSRRITLYKRNIFNMFAPTVNGSLKDNVSGQITVSGIFTEFHKYFNELISDREIAALNTRVIIF